jgi:nitroreductase
MEALEAILSRRSIRKYGDTTVGEEAIEKLLRAAMSAPSAGNQQPWHFVVIDERDILKKVEKVNPYAGMASGAPLAVLICAEPALEKFPGYWVQDCSAAAENMLLAAHAMGLGAVWTGIYPMEDRVTGFRELLSLPDDVIPLALIVIGHPAEEKPPSERFLPGRIHRNGWGRD